jgi:hypothetical protein
MVRVLGTTRFSGGGGGGGGFGYGTGSIGPRDYNGGGNVLKSSGSCLENREYGRRDLSC